MNKLSGQLPSRSFKHKCEWCNSEYLGTKFSTLCSRRCMYEQRKSKNWEIVVCKHCAIKFKRRKNERHARTGKKRMFCSSACHLHSDYQKQKVTIWANSPKNHWNNSETQKKVKETKLRVHGDAGYNNQEKSQATMMGRYGVHSPFCLPSARSNGHRISSVQRRVFEEVKKKHKDAILEHYLSDVKLSVDIFIPETKQVIEVFGDYWHMNPKLYNKHDFNINTKLTAEETWKKDTARLNKLQSAGYDASVIWENHTHTT